MLLRSIRTASVALVLAASALACSGSQSVGEPTATAAQGTTVAPINVSVHGQARVVANALAQVPLRADQRATIEQMAKDAEVRQEPQRKARETLMLAIADQVQAGTINEAALQPQIDAITAAHVAARPLDRAAFEKLHELLTADQRTAFVTAMQGNAGNHEGKEGKGNGQMRGRMQKWAADIGLSQDQQDQIRQKLQARWQQHVVGAVVGTDEQKGDAVQTGTMMAHGHQMHEQMKATLEAFKGDKFSMDQVSPIQNEQPMAHEFAGHMLGMLEAALPVLTADQRTAAANKLRQRAANLEAEDEAARYQVSASSRSMKGRVVQPHGPFRM
jgi:Spy/CpxP family protein refolding chaperone